MIAHCLSGDKKKWFLILAKSSVMQAFGKPLPFSLPFSVNGEHLRQNLDGHNIPMHVSLPDRKVTSKSYLGLALRESVRLCMLRTQTQHGCVYAWATPLPCDIKQSQWDIVSWTIMLLLQVLAFACKGSLQVLSRQEQLKVYWYVYILIYLYPGDKAGWHFVHYANLAFPSPAEHAYCRSGHCAHDFGTDLLRPPGLHPLIIAFVEHTRHDCI